MAFDAIITQWLSKGGLMIWPLLAGSVIALAVVLDRAFHQACARGSYRRIAGEAKQALRANAPAPARLQRSRVPAARIATLYLVYARHSPKVRNGALQREGERILAGWNRNLRVLSTFAHVAPLLGLLGTVTGLVAAFYQIEISGGHAQPSDLAGGIWEALVTTVAGLGVGIPCLLAYHFFRSSGDKAAQRMQEIVSELDELAEELGRGHEAESPGSSAPPPAHAPSETQAASL